MDQAQRHTKRMVKKILSSSITAPILSWFFFHPLLRVLKVWKLLMQHASAEYQSKQVAQSLALELLSALDVNGTGALALVDMKSGVSTGDAESKLSGDAYNATTWLANDRRFRSYSVDESSTILFEKLVEAMAVFESEKYKYLGILW